MNPARETLLLDSPEHVGHRGQEQHACLLASFTQADAYRLRPDIVLRPDQQWPFPQRLTQTGRLEVDGEQHVEIRAKAVTNLLLLFGRDGVHALPRGANGAHFLDDELSSIVEAGCGARERESNQKREEAVHRAIHDVHPATLLSATQLDVTDADAAPNLERGEHPDEDAQRESHWHERKASLPC